MIIHFMLHWSRGAQPRKKENKFEIEWWELILLIFVDNSWANLAGKRKLCYITLP
jgi:hypothetical protein